jgi:hypothetical protein
MNSNPLDFALMKVIIIVILGLFSISTFCQTSVLLSHFSEITEDEVIDTRKNLDGYFKLFREKSLPEDLSLRYFFDNDLSKMQAVFESYNMDEDTYTYVPYSKRVIPLHQKKGKEFILLHYGIESELFLSFYSISSDQIVETIRIADFSDEYGNSVTHALIFPGNHLVIVEIDMNVLFKLIEIDFSMPEFRVLKNIDKSEVNENQDKIFESAFDILKISKTGELMKN